MVQFTSDRSMKGHRPISLRRIRQKEYDRLRILVPALKRQRHVNKVTVIEEAIKYIDSLHEALLQNIQQKRGCTLSYHSLVTAAHKLFLQSRPDAPRRDPTAHETVTEKATTTVVPPDGGHMDQSN